MNLTTLWVVVGAILILMELFLPTAFIEATLGASALVVALLSLVIPNFTVQVVLWVIFSIAFLLALRRFMPKPHNFVLEETREARTISAILPGQTGRVMYEGISWQARCEDYETEINENELVFVVNRRGNTLYVVPEKLMH